MIRVAISSDIPALLAIENASFTCDRITLRNFWYLITRANSITLIDEQDTLVRGYLTLLFRSNSPLSRIYSIATNADFLGQGVAAKLLNTAEHIACTTQCSTMRLEVRKDNQASLALFQKRGYHKFAEYPCYYQDGMAAHRLQKLLTNMNHSVAPSMAGLL